MITHQNRTLSKFYAVVLRQVILGIVIKIHRLFLRMLKIDILTQA